MARSAKKIRIIRRNRVRAFDQTLRKRWAIADWEGSPIFTGRPLPVSSAWQTHRLILRSCVGPVAIPKG